MSMTACLWFDGQAREAAEFYVSVFRDGKLGSGMDYSDATSEASGQPKGTEMIVDFEVEGQKFLALNGGPQFTFSEAISFIVKRDTQEELDELWSALLAGGGKESQCGWLKDRFGMSWQVVPSNLPDLMTNEAATAALMKMVKINIAELEAARDGELAAH